MKTNKKFVFFAAICFAAVVPLHSMTYAAQTVEYSDAWYGNGLRIDSEGKGGLDLTFSVGSFTYEDKQVDGKAAQAIKMAGSLLPIGAGYPDLPVVSNYVAVPYGAKPKVTVVSYREERYQNVDIAPGMELPTDLDKSIKPLQRKSEIYSKNEFFPSDFVMYSKIQKMRGVDVFTLSFSPFRYNPVTKELIVRRDMKVSITFEGGKGEFGDDLYRHPMFERILQQNIVNYSSIQPSRYSQIVDQAMANEKSGGKETGEFEYIIIVPDDASFLAWADTIKQFRKKQGIKTGIFTTTEIGGNTPAILEAFIDNAYNNWTIKPIAVLMMSDLGSTNKAYGLTSSHFMAHPAGYDDYVSDNVFGDVDITDAASTWSNGGAPEIVFTRMPAQTAAHCSTMVKKIINYEKSPPGSATFYNLPLSAAGWQDERWFGMCSEIVRGFLKTKLGKTTQQQYALVDASGPAAGDPWSTTDPSALVATYGPTGENYIAATVPAGMVWNTGTGAGVVTAINNGTFMIMHRDHGAYYGWGEPAFTNTNIPSLTNTLYPFVFSMNCQTGAFQNTTQAGGTFSEQLHRSLNGALGMMCATEVSYSFVNDALIMGITDGMWPNFNSTNNWDVPNAGSGQTYERYTEDLRPAFALVSGKWHLMTQTYTDAAIPADYKEFTCHLFHVFGDPFMTFCSQIPDTFTLTFNSVIPTGTQSFSVNVKNKAGANVMGALVGVYMPTNSPEIVTSALTDANGNVSITINPLLDGTLYVTATKSNFVRKETYTTVNAGTPSKPTISKLFDGAKVPELRPYLSFYSTDPQNNSIDYRVIWDTTSNFNSGLKDSTTTTTYSSGATVNFQFPSNLTAGRTYWWKVKGRDPAGTNVFGPESDARSMTIGTDIPSGTASWYHNKNAQFSLDSYTGAAVIKSDSVILASPASGSGTLLSEGFDASTSLPSGWSSYESTNNSYDWTIGTSTGVVNVPPSYGTYYVYISYPSAGGGTTADADELRSPFIVLPSGTSDLALKYGRGYNYVQSGDSLSVWMRFSGGGSWTMLRCYTADVTSSTDSINVASYLPKDSIQFMWRFSSPGGRNGEDAGIDNVVVSYNYIIPNTDGVLTTGPIAYKDVSGAGTTNRSAYKWGKILWRKKSATDSIGVRIDYLNNDVWAPVPDAVLPGNSDGHWRMNAADDSVSLNNLDTLVYDSLRAVVLMYRPASKASTNPVLISLEMGRPGAMTPTAVVLSNFTAMLTKDGVNLQWRTESEHDCLKWDIERASSEIGDFKKIGTVDGCGTTNEPTTYNYIDQGDLAEGVYFYRLIEYSSESGEIKKTYYGPASITIKRSTSIYSLEQAFPNPSTGCITIKYSLKNSGYTNLRIYNILGAEIKTLVNGRMEPNNYVIGWDGKDNNGKQVANGVYFYKLESGGFSSTKKFMLVK
jgi:hypothetical protein